MLPTYGSSSCFFPTHRAPRIRRHSSMARELRAPNLLSFLMDADLGIRQAPRMSGVQLEVGVTKCMIHKYGHAFFADKTERPGGAGNVTVVRREPNVTPTSNYTRMSELLFLPGESGVIENKPFWDCLPR